MIVVDTNIIAYLLINGEQTASAEQVRNSDAEWAAPMLWRSEMRNLLMLYVRRGITALADAKIIMSEAESYLLGHEYDVSSHRILELAHSSGCTAYDCEFVALAEQLRVQFVTSDKKLLVAFPEMAVSMNAFTA